MGIFSNVIVNFIFLAVSFYLLVKLADLFVDSSVGISEYFGIPRIIVGILIVGFATTAPEISVSVISALSGFPDIAFGNALGSVICDDGAALALAAIFAPVPIIVHRHILKTTGVFLIVVDIIAYFLARNGYISRLEGLLLVSLMFGYIAVVIYSEKRKKKDVIEKEMQDIVELKTTEMKNISIKKEIAIFILALLGVLGTSRVIVFTARNIALHFGVSDAIIGLTIVAFGTSLPEITTAIVAARKGEGEIAVGDIIGADILNILWILGVTSIVNPIHVDIATVNFSFFWMILIVVTMLGSMWFGGKLDRKKGFLLLTIYLIYLGMNIRKFLS
jgi:cation:H+ antiporter